jgi:hypothetical protein
MTMARPPRKTMAQIFGWPLLIAASTAVGLVAALLGDGIWDALSWVALAAPVAIFGLSVRPRRPFDRDKA